ncbi:MAG: hypothetical protein MUO37_12185 [Methyloceanibacter sp.]|nr:hypothetical protein [Methyloceanibacter sp.]
MPIRGLTDRQASFPEIGQVRKGAPKPEDGKKPGADLKWFRVEIDEAEPATAAAFVKYYGDKPTEIDILLPFDSVAENFEAWREAYVAGGLIHRCDGERVWYEIDPRTGERLIVAGEPNKRCDGLMQCKPTGRLKVLVPQLQRLAYLTVMTTSIHDIMNLSRQLEALLQINGKLAGVPLKLRRRPVLISTPSGPDGKRARREKWLLSIEADPSWVKAKLLAMKAAALPGNGLGEELPTLEAPHDPEDDEHGPEWTEGAFAAGETGATRADPEPQNDAKRPYPPEVVRQKIDEKAAAHLGDPASDAQRNLVIGMLEACFAGDTASDKKRHTVLKYLFGVTSSNDLTAPQVLALLDWLAPTRDSGGAYKPNVNAHREAAMIVVWAMKEAGQGELI